MVSDHHRLKRAVYASVWGVLAAMFIYYTFLQLPGGFSKTRLGLAGIIALVGAVGMGGLLQQIARLASITIRQQRTDALLFTSTGCAFLWFLWLAYGRLPVENLLLPSTRVQITLPPGAPPVEIHWLNSGLTDISFRSLRVQGGTSDIADGRILVSPEPEQSTSLEWLGRAWGEMTVELGTGPERGLISLAINDQVEQVDLFRSTPGSLRLVRPVYSPFYAVLPPLIVTAGFFFCSLLVFYGLVIAFWKEEKVPTILLRSRTTLSGKLFLGVLALIALSGLGLVAEIGWHNRYLYDDYCYAASARQLGLLGCLSTNLTLTNGRFTQMTVLCLIETIQPLGFQLSVAVVQSFLLLSLLVLVRQVLPGDYPFRNLSVLAFSSGLWAILILATPYIEHTIIWYSGMASVTPSLILFSFLFSLLVYRLHRDDDRSTSSKLNGYRTLTCDVTIFLLSFLAVGDNETIAAVLIGLAVFLLLLSLALVFPLLKKACRSLFILLAGAGVGFLFMALLPGTSSRLGGYEHPSSLVELARIFISGVLSGLESIFGGNAGSALYVSSLLIGLVAGLFLGRGNLPRRNFLQGSALSFLLGVLAFMGAFLPSAYALSGNMPQRTMVLPAYFLVVGNFFTGYFLGRAVAPQPWKLAPILLVLVIATLAILFQVRYLPVRDTFRRYAAGWDQRMELIQQAKMQQLKQIVVEPIVNQDKLLGDLQSSSGYWVNRCASRYFGIDIRTR